MPSVGDLPYEIFDTILSFLDATEPPSSKFLHEQPSMSMVKSDLQPLKNLSRTCHAMRCLTFTTLFKYTKVHLTAECLSESQVLARTGSGKRRETFNGTTSWADPQIAHILPKDRLFFRVQDVANFLAFVDLHRLSFNIASVLFYVSSPTPNLEFDPADDLLEPLLQKIIETINPETLAILAPPSVMHDLARVGADRRDAWAFDMPLHTLRLKQPASSSGPAVLAKDSDYGFRRPWCSVLYNEGSFLKVYRVYEYFSKCVPSLLTLGCMCNCTTLGDQRSTPLLQLGRVRNTTLLGDYMDALAKDPWDRLQTFDFIVQFPLRSHTNNVLWGLYHCAPITSLRTKLVSRFDSDIWKDPAITSTHADLWMEFEESYKTILDVVQRMGDNRFLKNFTSLDCATPGEEILDDIFTNNRLNGWYEREMGCFEKADR